MYSKLKFGDLRIDDADALFDIYSDADAMKFRGSKVMSSIDDALEFVKDTRKTEGETLTNRKGVFLRKRDLLIGSSMIRKRIKNNHEYEIGYSIGRKYWGQGYGTEIVTMLLNYIDKKKEISSIIAWCHINNIASIRILEKNGFSKDLTNSIKDAWLFRK